MNNERRKRVDDLIFTLNTMQDELTDILNEEEECRDNIPESLWGTERYETIDENCGNLESANEALEELVGYLEDSKG